MPDLNDVLHIPLNDFTYEEADELYDIIRILLRQKGLFHDVNRMGGPAPVNHFINLEREFQKILSRLWVGIVKPVLDGISITVCSFSWLIML